MPDHRGADIVGMIGLVDAGGDTELAVWIDHAWRNRGIATEAARATLSIARTLGHCRLLASHYADSPATACILAKLGFMPTGHGRMRHSPARGYAELVQIHVLDLCPTASDPVDPEVLRRAA
jgi:RimJ/RimL family protein N-acetyltransferase